MPTITHTDYLFQATASGVGLVPGVWVRLLNNSTAANYYSTAVTDATSAFTHSAPPGDYSLYTGKVALINGAGTAGDVLSTTIASVTNGTTAVTVAAAVLTVSGANAALGTDNAVQIQLAINSQQTLGGRVKVPRDSYGGKYLVAA